MSEWSEKNSSQTSLSILWFCKPFGIKRNKFVINFRENSKKFIIEILTKNIALNLSGAFFFIGIGYSLKWWYKDQLFVILLKQNLPVFSEPEHKISWETGEYALNKIKEQQKRLAEKNKNVPTFHIFDMTSVPSSASSFEGGVINKINSKLHKPLENYLLEEELSINSLQMHDNKSIDFYAKQSFATDKDKSFLQSESINFVDNSFAYPWGKEMHGALHDKKKSSLLTPIHASKMQLIPLGVRGKGVAKQSFAEQLGVSYDLIDRIDLYTNQIVVKLKQPWQKHVYQRFIGIFAKSTNSIDFLQSELCNDNTSIDFVDKDKSSLLTPIHASKMQLIPLGVRGKGVAKRIRRSFANHENSNSIDSVNTSSTSGALSTPLIRSPLYKALQEVDREKDTKFRDCSSEKRTNNFSEALIAERGLEEQEKFSIYTPWKQLFPETWFKLSARSFCFLNQELLPAFNSLSGLTKLKARSPYVTHTHSRDKSWMSSMNYVHNKFSYPLELTKTLTGWQPSIDVLLLNSYLDEIPYKLENVLQPYFPKKDSELLFLSTSFIKSINYVDNRSIVHTPFTCIGDATNTPKGKGYGGKQEVDRSSVGALHNKYKSSIIPSLILPLEKSNLSLQENTTNSSNLNAPLSLHHTESVQKKYANEDLSLSLQNSLCKKSIDLLSSDKRTELIDPKKVVVNNAYPKDSMELKKASETPLLMSISQLKKSQLFEIKQLLKNELQSLINTLPLAVIDQFFSNEYLQKILYSQEEKKDIADVTTNVLGVKTLAKRGELTNALLNTPFNLQIPLNSSADLFYGAKKNLYIPLVTENIFFPSTPPVTRSFTPLHASGFANIQGLESNKSNKIFDVTGETLSLYQSQPPSNEMVTSLEQFSEASMSSVRGNSALTDFGKTQALDPLFLLNSLGFTFNNFSPLTNPTILLPTSTNSSPTFLTPNAVRLWKQVVSTKLTPNFANISSKHLVPQKGKEHKEPINFVDTKKLINFSYNKAKYNDSQNSKVEGIINAVDKMLLQQKPTNLNKSGVIVHTPFTCIGDATTGYGGKQGVDRFSYLVASQPLQGEMWINPVDTFFHFDQKNLIWDIFQQPKYDKYLSPNIKEKIFMESINYVDNRSIVHTPFTCIGDATTGYGGKQEVDRSSVGALHDNSKTLNPSELEAQEILTESTDCVSNESINLMGVGGDKERVDNPIDFTNTNASLKTRSIFYNGLEKGNTENHQLVSKAQFDQTYDSEKTKNLPFHPLSSPCLFSKAKLCKYATKKEKKDITSHIKRINFSQKKTTLGTLSDVNLVDKGVNFVNKKSRCMSGYVYPDIQSNLLKAYLYKWLSQRNNPTLLALRPVFLSPSFTYNSEALSTFCPVLSEGFAKLIRRSFALPITPLEFPLETSLLQLMDKACLTSLKIPITPTTFLLRFFQQQPSSYFGHLARTLPVTLCHRSTPYPVGVPITPPSQATSNSSYPVVASSMHVNGCIEDGSKISGALSSVGTLSLTPYHKFNHYLAKFPGFSEPSQFFTNLSVDYLRESKMQLLTPTDLTASYLIENSIDSVNNRSGNEKRSSTLSKESALTPLGVHNETWTSPSSTEMNNVINDKGVIVQTPFTPTGYGGRQGLVIDEVDNVYPKELKYENLAPYEVQGHDGERNKLFVNCNRRKVSYRGIVVQRNHLTKDFQPFKGFLKQSSIWGTLFLGAENPLTDRQCHFFGQKQLSTLDTNSFQRDYLRQLGKETLIQSNSKGFTELSKFSSIERTKILSFSKKVNSFFFKKRKYSYLLEPKDQWYLLFQKQLRTALEDGRKYPPLHYEGAKRHSSEETKFDNTGRIKVSAPLIMARFPKEIATLPLINNKQNTFFQGNIAYDASRFTKMQNTLDPKVKKPTLSYLEHNIPWRPFCFVEPSHLLMPSILPFNCREISRYLESLPFSKASGVTPSKIIQHYPFSTERSYFEISDTTWPKKKNNVINFSSLHSLVQEPLNGNSWTVMNQWLFLIALLLWIEQILLENVLPSLFALEQILLGITGIKSGDRTHVIRISKSETPKFQNLAGVDGLLGELSELVLFLRGQRNVGERFWNNKNSYGVLLTGPPGTGKTFLVRALANEANVPVLILSASTLAANKLNSNKPSWSIRHAFRRAKQLSPCILFIDELDALGKSRGKIVTDINEIVTDANTGSRNQNQFMQLHENSSMVPNKIFSSNRFSYEQFAQNWPSVSNLLLNKWEEPIKSTLFQESNEINRNSLCKEKLIDFLKGDAARESNGRTDKSSYDTTPPNETSKIKTRDFEAKISFSSEAVGDSQEYQHSNKNEMIQGENTKRKFGPLTQLLVSMDGVSSFSGVLIMGATNRPELLDPALTRPGRFEKIIRLEKPSEQNRIEILQLYSHNLGVQHQIPWSYLANRTIGLTTADLSVAMNYSSLKAISEGSTHTIETIEYGLNSIARSATTSLSSYPLREEGRQTTIPIKVNLKKDKTNTVQGSNISIPSRLSEGAITPLTKRAIFFQRHFNFERNLYTTVLSLRAYKTLHRTFSDPLWGSEVQQAIPSTKIKSNSLTIFSSYFSSNSKSLLTIYPVFPTSHPLAKRWGLANQNMRKGALTPNRGLEAAINSGALSTSCSPPYPLHASKMQLGVLVAWSINYVDRKMHVKGICTITRASSMQSVRRRGYLFHPTIEPNALLIILPRASKKQSYKIAQTAYYQAGKIVVQTLLPEQPPVALITLNTFGTTLSTAADTYIPIESTFNSQCCSFLESRLISLYGGKAASLLIEYQYQKKLAVKFEKANSIDFLQSELCNDNKSIDFYAKQIRRSFATDKDKSSLQSESINFYAKQIRRSFATDNSFAYPRRGKEMPGALHDKNKSSLITPVNSEGVAKQIRRSFAKHDNSTKAYCAGTGNNIFQSTIGNIEIQIATRLATIMVNYWNFYSSSSKYLQTSNASLSINLMGVGGGKKRVDKKSIDFYAKQIRRSFATDNSFAIDSFHRLKKERRQSSEVTVNKNNKNSYTIELSTGSPLKLTRRGIKLIDSLCTITHLFWKNQIPRQTFLEEPRKNSFLEFYLRSTLSSSSVLSRMQNASLKALQTLQDQNQSPTASYFVDNSFVERKEVPLRGRQSASVEALQLEELSTKSIELSLAKQPLRGKKLIGTKLSNYWNDLLSCIPPEGVSKDLLSTKLIELIDKNSANDMAFVASSAPFFKKNTENLLFKKIVNSSSVERKRLSFKGLINLDLSNGLKFNQLRQCFVKTKIPLSVTKRFLTPLHASKMQLIPLGVRGITCIEDATNTPRGKGYGVGGGNEGTFPLGKEPLLTRFDEKYLLFTISQSINSIDFLQSELCNDNKSIDFYAKQIRRSFATDKDKSSLQSELCNYNKSLPRRGCFVKHDNFKNSLAKRFAKRFAKRSVNKMSSYNMLRTSVENIGNKSSKFYSQVNIFQLINSLQFSNLERNRFYPGWFRLYLPDIEATQFFKNVGNFYFNLGLQTLTRPSLNELTLKLLTFLGVIVHTPFTCIEDATNTPKGKGYGGKQRLVIDKVPTDDNAYPKDPKELVDRVQKRQNITSKEHKKEPRFRKDLGFIQSCDNFSFLRLANPFRERESKTYLIVHGVNELTEGNVLAVGKKGLFSLVQNLKKVFFYHTNNNLSIGVGLLRKAAKRRNQLNRIEYRSKDSPLSYSLHKRSSQKFQVSELPPFPSDQLAKLQERGVIVHTPFTPTGYGDKQELVIDKVDNAYPKELVGGFYISQNNQKQNYQQDIQSSLSTPLITPLSEERVANQNFAHPLPLGGSTCIEDATNTPRGKGYGVSTSIKLFGFPRFWTIDRVINIGFKQNQLRELSFLQALTEPLNKVDNSSVIDTKSYASLLEKKISKKETNVSNYEERLVHNSSAASPATKTLISDPVGAIVHTPFTCIEDATNTPRSKGYGGKQDIDNAYPKELRKERVFDVSSAGNQNSLREELSTELIDSRSLKQLDVSFLLLLENHIFPINYNGFSVIEKELLYHSLINNCFAKAFQLVNQNRQLLDFFADYLLRFQILRQHQILYLFSAILLGWRQASEGRPLI